jgi:hypothetical protein
MISDPQSAEGTALEIAASRRDGGSFRRPWIWSVTSLVVMIGVGVLIGWALLGAARASQACSAGGGSGSWAGIAVSGLPSSLQSSFGYGRGTQVIESTLTATARPGAALPARISVFAEPLSSADGTQVIPALAQPTSSRSQRGISAVATRIASSSTYQLEVCVQAPSATPGSYSSQLLFPGATLTSGTSLPVTVTFQSEIVPFIVTVGLVPLSVLGMAYTALILLRRTNPHLELKGIMKALGNELWSINGLTALILSIGAVFTAWTVQCFRNPTWGTPWPTILGTLVAMAGSAVAASTVPMGLSKA